VGLLGVLLTRGHPTYIGPESVLTFRVEEPVNISTERAPQAFRTVQPEDYQAPANFEARGPRPYGPRPYGPPPPPPYYYGYGYPYYPYYYGPSFGVFYGPSFYYRGGFYRRGFHR
jgi:hypothetical protein